MCVCVCVCVNLKKGLNWCGVGLNGVGWWEVMGLFTGMGWAGCCSAPNAGLG